MQKFFLAALVAAALFAPTGVAQGQTVTVEIEDLPASGMSNGTSIVVPFKVHATISDAPACISQSTASSYTIDLTASVTNSTGNRTTATVNPRQVTIAGPLLLPPVPGASAERTEDATLVVNAGPYDADQLNATILVTATFAGGNGGCTGSTAAASASDEAEFLAGFEPVRGFGASQSSGAEMPGPAFTVLLLALVGVALVARRFA